MPEVSCVERWLPIPDWEGYYEVSDLGRIRGVDRVVPDRRGVMRTLKGTIIAGTTASNNGYRMVLLSRDAKKHGVSVHATVLKTFKGPPPHEGQVCRHDNGIKADCRLSNLYWGTYSENAHDKRRHGTDWQVNKARCPRKHLYAGPNLYRRSKRLKGGKRGTSRECLACRRASTAVTEARRAGRPDPDFDALAHANYQQIMRGETER